MNIRLFIKIFLCLFIFGLMLYRYLDRQNTITELRLQIPALEINLSSLSEENVGLQFIIDHFESPENLMELLKLLDYSYLKYIQENEIIDLSK